MIFVGDIHGEFRNFIYTLKRCKITDTNIIVAGDFGIGFYKENYYITEFNKMNKYLISKNVNIYVVRGNHDNPSYFLENKNYDNIHLMKDYSIIEIENKRILALGGAFSIDRKYRKLNVDYWDDELFNYDENLLNKIECDIVVSHSAPDFCLPLKKVIDDNSTINEMCNKERNDLSKSYQILSIKNKITHWYYGHFHENNYLKYNDTIFKGLGISAMDELL